MGRFQINSAVDFQFAVSVITDGRRSCQSSGPQMVFIIARAINCRLLPDDATQSAALLRQVVCPSLEFGYRDHINWKSSNVISRLVSLVCWLSVDPNITDLLQGEQPEILSGKWVG